MRLGAAVRATRREVAKHAGAETFDRDGEPAKARADDGSTTTVGRLSRAVATGDLVPDDGDALAFLMAAYGLAAPAGLPQAAPCVRSVCVLARDGGGAVAYEIRVYATRLLFYLIADDAVRALVNDAEDVQSAIALATELDDPIDLWRVIVEQCAANATSAATLLARVKTLAGGEHAFVVIAALRDGVAIDRLKTRLIDIMDENTALTRSLRESHAFETRRAETSNAARAKAFARALRRRQIHISRRR